MVATCNQEQILSLCMLLELANHAQFPFCFVTTMLYCTEHSHAFFPLDEMHVDMECAYRSRNIYVQYLLVRMYTNHIYTYVYIYIIHIVIL